jgi:hypothetical protein
LRAIYDTLRLPLIERAAGWWVKVPFPLGTDRQRCYTPAPMKRSNIIAQGKLLGGKEIWGRLALAGGKLVIRDQSQMKCVDLRAP